MSFHAPSLNMPVGRNAGELLLEVPAHTLQAVLAKLELSDVAALNRVNRYMHARIVGAANAVCLRLHGNPATYLSSWDIRTMHMCYAPAARIELIGSVSPADLEAAIHMLALRPGQLRELELTPGRHAAAHQQQAWGALPSQVSELKTAKIDSVAPLAPLAHQLTGLSLAQGLMLRCSLADSLLHGDLPRMPSLVRLHAGDITLGSDYVFQGWRAVPHVFAALAVTLPEACPRLEQLSLSLVSHTCSNDNPGGGAPLNDTGGTSSTSETFCTYTAAIALVAAAVSALPHLQELELTQLPNVWGWKALHSSGNHNDSGSDSATIIAHRRAALALCGANTALDMICDSAAAVSSTYLPRGRLLQQRLVASRLPPPASLSSLEALGLWLCDTLPHLSRLRLHAINGTTLKWQLARGTSAHAGGCGDVSRMRMSLEGACDLLTPSGARRNHAAMAAASGSNSSPDYVPSHLHTAIAAQLGDYVPRLQPAAVLGDCLTSLQPAAVLGDCVVALRMVVPRAQLHELPDALAGARMLRHLLLAVRATSRQQPTPLSSLLAVAAVAAESSGCLESLVLLPGLGVTELPPGALQPLVASCAATLRTLRLVGCFALPGASRDYSRRDSNAPLQPPETAAAAAGRTRLQCRTAADSSWQGLGKLTLLHCLEVHQVNAATLPLPVTALPASLRVLTGWRLKLLGPLPYPQTPPSTSAAATQLTELRLHHCELQDVAAFGGSGRMSGSLLRVATLDGTSWPGGWPAAGGAWPQLRTLSLQCPRGTGSCSSTHAQVSDALLTQLLSAFPGLCELSIQGLHCLTGASLARLAAQLHRVSVTCSSLEPDAAAHFSAALATCGDRRAASSVELRLPAVAHHAVDELAGALHEELPWAAVAVV